MVGVMDLNEACAELERITAERAKLLSRECAILDAVQAASPRRYSFSMSSIIRRIRARLRRGTRR